MKLIPEKTSGVIAAFLSLLLVSSELRADISARGSDSTLLLFSRLVAAYEAETGVKIAVQGGGSNAGAKAVQAGEVALAFLSRELKAEEKSAGLVGWPYAMDGVAVLVHKTNPISNLTLAELKEFYTARTTTWPDGSPLVLFTRNTDSGTREVFQQIVLGSEQMSPKAAIKHERVIFDAVGKIPAAVGYCSFFEVEHDKVNVVAVNGVVPSAETVKDKTYPLARTVTLTTKGEPRGEAKAFMEFVVGPKGQAVVAREGYVSLK